MEPEKTNVDPDDKPPILGAWTNLYAFVLILHAIVITLFYLFTKVYS
ncbi:MAG TPA: hypothetical protein PKE06_16610 [Flavilitoribacter sp.]|nr:hypothetical protein [Flavilitoribacter sp.]HMQ89608.1 hypothetical protein [Flavilitoribacter sp.]